MKSKSKSRQKQVKRKKQDEAAMSAPGIDEIITISRDSGKPRLEMKRAEDEAVPKGEAKVGQAEEKKERAFRLPKKPESKIQTRKPRADILKEAIAEEKHAAKKKETKNKTVSDNVSEPKTDAPRTAPLSESKAALAEAALFLSPKPLMLDELARIMGVNSLGYVKETLERLSKDYEGSGIEVVSSAAGWEMQVRPQYLSSVAHLAPYADLSEGPKRALALILFKEPLKQSDLIKMQGNKVYAYLKVLERLGMIRRGPCGRTKKLTLTKEFERYFGEEKAKIKERLGQELAMQPAQQLPAQQKKPRIDVKAELKKMDIRLEDT